jgi:hypothetical protein
MTETEEHLLSRINYAAYLLQLAKSLDGHVSDALAILNETLQQYDDGRYRRKAQGEKQR